MDTGSPYNPFSSHHVAAPRQGGYIFPEGRSLDDVLAKLETAHWRGELTGNHGAGKSTMLADICAALKTRGLRVTWWQSSQHRRFPPRGWWNDIRNNDVIAYDGAERLFPGLLWGLRILTHAMGRGFILTTHWRHGLGAAIEVKPEPRALAQKYDKTWLGYDDPEKWVSRLEDGLARHNGDSRKLWLELYDEYEKKYRESRS